MKTEIIESPVGDIITTKINGHPMIDAVALTKLGDKRLLHWEQRDATKELISGLESMKDGIPSFEIVDSKPIPGGGKTPRRVWIGKELAIDLMMWISVDFRIKCLQVLNEFFHGNLQPAQLDEMAAAQTAEEILLVHLKRAGSTPDIKELYQLAKSAESPPAEKPSIKRRPPLHPPVLMDDLDKQLIRMIEALAQNDTEADDLTAEALWAALPADLRETYHSTISLGKAMAKKTKPFVLSNRQHIGKISKHRNASGRFYRLNIKKIGQ